MSFEVRNNCHRHLIAGDVFIERYRAEQLGIEQRIALADLDVGNYLLCSAIERIVLDGRDDNPSWAFPQFRTTDKGFVLTEIRCGGSRTGYAVAAFEEVEGVS